MNYLDKTEVIQSKVEYNLKGCWLWQGRIFKTGYGYIPKEIRDNLSSHSHRFSWQFHKGPIPKGLWVLHTCDIKHCINPNHLYLGTNDDNIKDKIKRGYPRKLF